jgi:hypothetical protein
MKAKTHPSSARYIRRQEEPIPHELGTHLFALIKRNLLARRQQRPSATPAPSQLTFAF